MRTDFCFCLGMELTTAEEVHVLCYFASAGCEPWILIRYVSSPFCQTFQTNRLLFGDQLIYDEQDQITGAEQRSADLSHGSSFLLPLYDLVQQYDGIMVPAHINKPTYQSCLETLVLFRKTAAFPV
ncbi:MAG: hypothetical protein ACLUD0_10850 [Eubacterium ramulus]